MNKVIASFGINDHSRLLTLAVPTFYAYAHQHDYDLFLPNSNFFNQTSKTLPPSWWKLDVIEYLLKSYEKVLWLDADIIIYRFEIDIADTMGDDVDFGVVVHETADGSVPNCGVWLLNQSSLNWLQQLKHHNSFRRSHCWWEQAALLHLLGVNPDSQNISLPESYNIPWTQLDYLWNPHVHDRRKIPEDTKFFHATGFTDRYSVMKNILDKIDL